MHPARLVSVTSAALALSACSSPAPAPAAPVRAPAPIALQEEGWAPENRAKLEAFIQAHGIGSPGHDPAKPPCAAFDFDMTSIFDDVGDATFYFQVSTLTLALTPAELEALLPAAFVSHPERSLAAERQETIDAYRTLHAAGLTGPLERPKMSLDGGRLDGDLARAHAVFRHRMIWFYQQLDEVDGARVAYPWVVSLYRGLTRAEVASLVEHVLAHELRDPAKGERCATLEVRHPDPAVAPLTIREGIVASPEVRELYQAFRASGIDPYVVTASFGPTVEVIANRLYDVPPDHVVGMRLQLGPDGRFAGDALQPITYRQGKVDNVRALLPREPIFAAGDSNTDVEMLSMESVQLRLILDREKDPASDIGRLITRARDSDPDHWLVQGRDDFGPDGTATGAWNGTTRSRPTTARSKR